MTEVATEVTDVSSINLDTLTCFKDVVNAHVGQKVAVLCARYQYRGVVSKVTDDCLILANSMSVEISGASAATKPEREDAIGGSVTIKLDAIEIFYQPNWSQFPLPNEEGYSATSA